MELAGSHVVVTGGGSGLGRALCRRFAREGASVVVADIDAPSAERVAGEIKGLAVRADVGLEADVKHLVEEATGAHGPIDIFVSNAGIAEQSDPFTSDAH